MAGPKLQERFLQWYVIKNPDRLPAINGQRVIRVVDNLDRFPDCTATDFLDSRVSVFTRPV